MVPWPAGLLFFSSNGWVISLFETTWKQNPVELPRLLDLNARVEGSVPVRAYIPVLPGSRRRSGRRCYCQCRKRRTSASAPFQNSSQSQISWKTLDSGSSGSSLSGQTEITRNVVSNTSTHTSILCAPTPWYRPHASGTLTCWCTRHRGGQT